MFFWRDDWLFKSHKRLLEYPKSPIKCHRFQELHFVPARPNYFSISSFHPQLHSVYQERGSFTRGNVVKRSKSSTKQNICRLMADITMSRLAVNTTRLPSFFPGPKILYTKSSSAGEIFIRRTTRKTCRKEGRILIWGISYLIFAYNASWNDKSIFQSTNQPIYPPKHLITQFWHKYHHENYHKKKGYGA